MAGLDSARRLSILFTKAQSLPRGQFWPIDRRGFALLAKDVRLLDHDAEQVCRRHRCLIFIICATLSSDGARPDLTGDETARVVFIGAYALLGTPLYIAYPRHLGLVCLLVLGSTMAARPRRA